MGANSELLAKALGANLGSTYLTRRSLEATAADVGSTASDLRSAGQDVGFDGLAGDAAAEAFVRLSRDCATLAENLAKAAAVATTAQGALEAAQDAYRALPPAGISLASNARSWTSKVV